MMTTCWIGEAGARAAAATGPEFLPPKGAAMTAAARTLSASAEGTDCDAEDDGRCRLERAEKERSLPPMCRYANGPPVARDRNAAKLSCDVSMWKSLLLNPRTFE